METLQLGYNIVPGQPEHEQMSMHIVTLCGYNVVLEGLRYVQWTHYNAMQFVESVWSRGRWVKCYNMMWLGTVHDNVKIMWHQGSQNVTRRVHALQCTIICGIKGVAKCHNLTREHWHIVPLCGYDIVPERLGYGQWHIIMLWNLWNLWDQGAGELNVIMWWDWEPYMITSR